VAETTIDRSEIEEKRQDLIDRHAAVRSELDRLSRLAMQMQGAIAGLDEILAPDVEDVLPDGMELDDGSK